MRLLLATAIMMLWGTGCLAADLPQRFIGVWMQEDLQHPGNPERCTKADWKPGFQEKDRVVLIDQKRFSPMEGGCRILSVKEAQRPYPRYPEAALAITVGLACAAEGEEKETMSTAAWAIHSIGGRTIMIQVNVSNPTKMDAYQKCP